MPFEETEFLGLYVFEPVVYDDSRGFFFESFNQKLLQENGIYLNFVQDNHSKSSSGVIRGLHFQKPPHAQVKFIRVIQGAILDVVVDIRIGSPTYGKVFSIELSAENKKQLFIPAGFAHGFSVLTPTAEVLYKCDKFYNKESESGIAFNDPELKIDWKIPAGNMIVSEKDLTQPYFKNIEPVFRY